MFYPIISSYEYCVFVYPNIYNISVFLKNQYHIQHEYIYIYPHSNESINDYDNPNCLLSIWLRIIIIF